MSLFQSLFRKTASRSQNKTIRTGRASAHSNRNAARSQEYLMDRIGSFEVSE